MATCSFCNSSDSERTYVEGNDSFICNQCIEVMHDMVVRRGIRSRPDLEKTGGKSEPKKISRSESMSKKKTNIFELSVTDDGLSYRLIQGSKEVSWEDGTRNLLSVGAQYIIAKMLDDIECFQSDCSKSEFATYFSDRHAELEALKNASFISPDVDFLFSDTRSGKDDDEPLGCPCLEGYRPES